MPLICFAKKKRKISEVSKLYSFIHMYIDLPLEIAVARSYIKVVVLLNILCMIDKGACSMTK